MIALGSKSRLTDSAAGPKNSRRATSVVATPNNHNLYARRKYVTPSSTNGGHPQVSTATLVGAVKDTSGGAIPGAAMTAKNIATGLARTVKTDSAGNYPGPHVRRDSLSTA